MALTNARQKAMIDTELADAAHHNYVALSSNGGVSEDADTPRQAVVFSTPAAGDPYSPGNTADLTFTPTHVAGTKTYTHAASCAGGVNGTADLDTIWIPITDPDPVVNVGGTTTIATGQFQPLKADRITVS